MDNGARPLRHVRHAHDSIAASAHIHWISWLGSLLYIQVVLAVGLFFALSASMTTISRSNMLATNIFVPLFISIPATAVLYLVAVIAFLFRTTIGDKRERWAIQITVAVALFAMLCCVWWVSRAFLR
jgi:hypothetical protein